MAALVKVMRVSKTINSISKLVTNLSLSSHNKANPSSLCKAPRIAPYPMASLHTTSKCSDIMEFFDIPKNWSAQEIKVGRSWNKDELRIKSNEDLHKLWFVLLKERNMLLTMEEVYKQEFEVFPNPERIDKVAISMENLETVVRERNKAYHMLETGENGERPHKRVYSQIGIKFNYRMRQYHIPKFANNKWHKNHKFGFNSVAVQKFLKLYYEKKWNEKRKGWNRQKNRVKSLMRKFPNLDWEAVKEQFPNVDIEKAKRNKYARGHYIPQ